MTSQSINILWRHANQLHHNNGAPANLAPLWFMTDQSRVNLPEQVLSQLPAGAGVIFRDYDHPKRPTLARSLSNICEQRGLLFLVAGDEELACAVRSDGMHVPEHLLPQLAAIRRRNPDWWITVAAHSMTSIRRAQLGGADAVLISPVFPTQSHIGAPTLGTMRLTALARQTVLPAYALGGVDAGNVRRLRQTPTAGFAAIGALAE